MDQSYKSGAFRVTFEVDVIIEDGHHGGAIMAAYNRLQELMEGSEKSSRHADGKKFDVRSDNLRGDAAWFNYNEIRQIVRDWSPQPGDTVRMWLEDTSVRGTLFTRERDGELMVGLVAPGVDPSTLDPNTFNAYLVNVDGRRRRMEPFDWDKDY